MAVPKLKIYSVKNGMLAPAKTKITSTDRHGLPLDVPNKKVEGLTIFTEKELLTGLYLKSQKRKHTNTGNGLWDFPEEMGGKGYVGFIYLIADLKFKKLYLGRKNFRSKNLKTKGKDSGWRDYTSSSTNINDAISTRGFDDFRFFCIEQYKTVGGLGYAETWSLCYVDALCNPKLWYNGLINKVSWKVNEPVTRRHLERLDNYRKIVEDEWQDHNQESGMPR